MDIHRCHKVEAIAKLFYETVAEELEDYPWDGASNETEREARNFAERAVSALEELDGLTNKRRHPIPQSIYETLRPVLTPGGIDKWWTRYLELDPYAQEDHAGEHARFFKETLGPKTGA
jgi:hypothetical protein